MTASHLAALSAGAVRRARLADARLYLVTDARSARGDLEAFLDVVLAAGVDVLQLREKSAEAGDILRAGRAFKEAADRYGALFIVNDRPDIALALDADGVHLGQNDLPVAIARRILGSDMIIGLSTHTTDEFTDADADADYLCAGPVFETPTKPGRAAAGHEVVGHASSRARDDAEARPWFAIGGINDETVGGVVAAGALRVVVVRAVTEAPDPADAVRGLLRLLPALP